MRPLPDLEDTQAMAAAGRRSQLWRARNEACEALRDATTLCQSADIGELVDPASQAAEAAQRLIDVSNLWKSL